MIKTIEIANEEEMRGFGESFSKEIENGGVVLLYGDLGAGKTTFTQGLAKGLAINQRIISPTFVLIREYIRQRKKERDIFEESLFYHIDLYRMNSEHDLEGLGLREILMDEKNIVVIEWAERMETLLPAKRWEIKIKALADRRMLNIEKI